MHMVLETKQPLNQNSKEEKENHPLISGSQFKEFNHVNRHVGKKKAEAVF